MGALSLRATLVRGRSGHSTAPGGEPLLWDDCVPRVCPVARLLRPGLGVRHGGTTHRGGLRGGTCGPGRAPAGARAAHPALVDGRPRRALRRQARSCGLRSGIDRTASGAGSRRMSSRNQRASNCWPASSMCPPPWWSNSGGPSGCPRSTTRIRSAVGKPGSPQRGPGTRMDRRSFLVLHSSALVGVAADWARVEPRHLIRALDDRESTWSC